MDIEWLLAGVSASHIKKTHNKKDINVLCYLSASMTIMYAFRRVKLATL